MNSTYKTLHLIFIGFLFLGLFSCKKDIKESPEKAETEKIPSGKISLSPKQMQNIGLSTTTLQDKNVFSLLKLNGSIDVPPQNMVSVSVPMGGYLKKTDLLPGAFVRKGQVIAWVEDPAYIQLQEEYLLTKNKIAYLTLEAERQRKLNKTLASSDKVTQMAISELRSQEIVLASLVQKLALIGISPSSISKGNISKSIAVTSPIDAYVSKVNANIGKYISPTDVIFELINPSDIHLFLKVFEKDIDKLFVGQKLMAYTNTNPEKKYACTVLLIAKDVSPDGRIDVHCHFQNYDPLLNPGTFMNAEVEVDSSINATLPQESIVSFEGKNYVFVKQNGNNANVFERVEVSLGNSQEGFVQILNSEVLTGKSIVLGGAYSLLMAMENKAED